MFSGEIVKDLREFLLCMGKEYVDLKSLGIKRIDKIIIIQILCQYHYKSDSV